MKRLILIVLVVGFGVWVYVVPLDGRLPKLGRIKSGIVMQISSTAFTNNSDIPIRYTCSGQNVSPGFEISGTPSDAKSLALVMDDPDAPNGTFTHWVVFNIDPKTKTIPEVGPIPGIQARNSAGLKQYTGPCPPSGTHRYYFKVYALDILLTEDEILNKTYLQQAMTGHILDEDEVMGKFSKEK